MFFCEKEACKLLRFNHVLTPTRTDYGMVVGSIFYRAYNILTEDLLRALDSMGESEVSRVQKEGLRALNWRELLERGGENSRVQHLKPHFVDLFTKNSKEVSQASLHLPKWACEGYFKGNKTFKAYGRKLLEWPWLLGRPLSKLTITNHNDSTCEDISTWKLYLAKLLAADALSQNAEREQSFGHLLSDFMPSIFNDSLVYGFSGHSAEECHELKYGEGSCSPLLMRDGACESKDYQLESKT